MRVGYVDLRVAQSPFWGTRRTPESKALTQLPEKSPADGVPVRKTEVAGETAPDFVRALRP